MADLARVFATEMRRIRDELGMAQEALGAKVDLDRNSVSRLERGAPNISLEKAHAIAAALGVTLSAMFSPSQSVGGVAVGLTEGSFPERVRAIRGLQKLNQRELAERMGVDRNLVNSVEMGKRRVTLRTVQIFADGLGVSPSDLV